MPPKARSRRARPKRSRAEQRVRMQFDTYCIAAKTETAVAVAALAWNYDTSTGSGGIGMWSTYRVLSVTVMAMPGISVHWRVLTATTKPTNIKLVDLMAHPDTVHSFNTTATIVQRNYKPSVSPYNFDQNWPSPLNFNSGLHVVYAVAGAGSTDVAALIIKFHVSLNNWIGGGKPLQGTSALVNLPSVSDMTSLWDEVGHSDADTESDMESGV